MYPEFVSCSVVMFHVLTSCVSFDYVVNFKKKRDFVMRDFIVLTNYVLITHPNSHEIYTDFHKFLVLTSYTRSLNHGKTYSQKNLCHI